MLEFAKKQQASEGSSFFELVCAKTRKLGLPAAAATRRAVGVRAAAGAAHNRLGAAVDGGGDDGVRAGTARGCGGR